MLSGKGGNYLSAKMITWNPTVKPQMPSGFNHGRRDEKPRCSLQHIPSRTWTPTHTYVRADRACPRSTFLSSKGKGKNPSQATAGAPSPETAALQRRCPLAGPFELK